MTPQVDLPPGPSEDVDVEQMRRAPLEFVTDLARRYGDVTCHRIDEDTVYLISRPDLAKQVLSDNGPNYTKLKTPDDDMLRPLLGNGLLTSNGAEWARQRHQCAPALRMSRVLTFAPVINDATTTMIDSWSRQIETCEPLEIDRELTALTLSIITRAILGADIAGVGGGFGEAVDAVNRYIGHYVPTPDPDPEDTAQRRLGFVRARQILEMITRTLIAARRGTVDPLLDAQESATLLDAMMGGDHALTTQELRDEVLTLVMAGHETTAKALTWTLYLLDQNPAEAELVREELGEVLGGREPVASDLAHLPRCRSAVQEAMRLYPPVWLISRRATDLDVLDGYTVLPGTLVCVSQWVLHRDPRYWDQPEEFVPSRFATRIRPSHLYLPFGGGDRICIGQHFALVEATLVLAVLMQRTRLSLEAGFVVEPEALVTLRPRYGMRMTATRL